MAKRWMALISTTVLACTPALAVQPSFGQIAEGRSSAAEDQGIVACYRMFTVPMLNDICPETPRPARLAVPHQPIRIVEGQWFPYSRVVVLAYDASGHLLPSIPIQLAVENVEPPFLDLRANMIAGDKVLPIREGRFRIAVDAACIPHDRPKDFVTAIAWAEVIRP